MDRVDIRNIHGLPKGWERDSLKCSGLKVHDRERLMRDPLAYWWSLAEAATSIELDELLGDLPRHSSTLKAIADPGMQPELWQLQNAISESTLLRKERYRIVRGELLYLVRDAWKRCGGDQGAEVARL
jgi:hypothetical protein